MVLAFQGESLSIIDLTFTNTSDAIEKLVSDYGPGNIEGFMQTPLVKNGWLKWFQAKLGEPKVRPTNAKEAYFKTRLDLMQAYTAVGFNSRMEMNLWSDHFGRTAFRLAGRINLSMHSHHDGSINCFICPMSHTPYLYLYSLDNMGLCYW